jgi:YVTN family beta-propeller protein
MKPLRFTLLSALCAGLIASCDDPETDTKGNFETGVFVVNEGNFNDADGTVSFFNLADKNVTLDLFGSVNSGRALGDVVQSMALTGDEAYVVVNNSNKVEIVNANTFEAIHTLTGVKLPRYFTAANGKGYLTEWVSFEDPGRVSVIDLATHEVLETITTDFGTENIIYTSNKLFVSNSFTNTITVINPVTNKVVNTLEVQSSPGEFVVDSQNKLWVICGGNYEGNDGALVQLDPVEEAVVKTVPLPINVPAKMATDATKSFLYYYKGKSVYKISIAATAAPADAWLTVNAATNLYSIGIDDEAGLIYLSDSKNFSGNGTAYRYTLDGAFVDTFGVGRGPNGFVFK